MEDIIHRIFECGFSWAEHEPGLTNWVVLDERYRQNVGEDMFNNKIPDIQIPKYREGSWMRQASIDGIIKAKEGIGLYIDWDNSKQGREYWLEAYKKLHVMENHLRIYMVIQRLGGKD